MREIDTGRLKVPLQARIAGLREQYEPIHCSPFMRKTVVIAPPHVERFNPDGTPNHQVYLRGPGVSYDPRTNTSVLLFEGVRPTFRNYPHGHSQHSAIFGAMSTDNWITAKFFDPLSEDVTDRSKAIPIFEPTPGEFSFHGQQDPRVTHFGQGTDLETYVIIANNVNLKTMLRAREEVGRDEAVPLRGGATPELYVTPNLSDPHAYRSLGLIGPDEYFHNLMLHPQLVYEAGRPHLLLIGRKLPGIQGFSLPLEHVEALLTDPTFRHNYWEEQFRPDNLQANTILNPLFTWEAFQDPATAKAMGHLAGGAPPIQVSYQGNHEEKNAWLFFYNAAPEYDAARNSVGRVVGAVLLDKDDPRKVISRSPMPVIWPTEGIEIEGGLYPNITFATGAYVDNKGILRVFYSAGDKNINMASCPIDEMVNYLLKFNANGELVSP